MTVILGVIVVLLTSPLMTILSILDVASGKRKIKSTANGCHQQIKRLR